MNAIHTRYKWNHISLEEPAIKESHTIQQPYSYIEESWVQGCLDTATTSYIRHLCREYKYISKSFFCLFLKISSTVMKSRIAFYSLHWQLNMFSKHSAQASHSISRAARHSNCGLTSDSRFPSIAPLKCPACAPPWCGGRMLEEPF